MAGCPATGEKIHDAREVLHFFEFSSCLTTGRSWVFQAVARGLIHEGGGAAGVADDGRRGRGQVAGGATHDTYVHIREARKGVAAEKVGISLG